MLYIYTMEYYSAIKRNESASFIVMWMSYRVKLSQRGKKNIVY